VGAISGKVRNVKTVVGLRCSHFYPFGRRLIPLFEASGFALAPAAAIRAALMKTEERTISS